MSSNKVLTGAQRKQQILENGARLAAKNGAENVTRRMVAAACKCAESLISEYMGDTATAQRAYTRKAKAIGLTLPNKIETIAIGKQLRAHGPRDKRDTRKRSIKEVEAIKRKSATGVRKAVAAKKSAAKKASTLATSSPGLPKGVSVTTRSTNAGTTVHVRGRRAGVDLREVVAAMAGQLPADQREVKPKRAPRPALPLPATAPTVPSPGEVPTPPERKTAARKPKAPPTAALPATPSS